MKTLVVFSALASIALAAPAPQNNGLEESGLLKNRQSVALLNTPAYLKREKKSPLDHGSNTVVHIVPTTEIHEDDDTSTITGKNTFTKPLIVKKKFGYRLYRDSEEEKANADSHETCGRQVKVKLCDEDGKFRQMLRSSAHEISNVPFEDDMKNSIKMAKEAVENLQRDLKKMENENIKKHSHESESDKDLHDDIEVARQALEHIHENLGNMSPQGIMDKDSENTHDVHFIIAKSEKEKMAQWKEAMNNIQKNVEIATNIEDSFRATGHPASLLLLDQSESMKSEQKTEDDINSHLEMDKDHHVRHATSMNLKVQSTDPQVQDESSLGDQTKTKSLNDPLFREEQHAEDDMKSSASENIEMKAIDIENNQPLRSENQQRHEQEKSALEDVSHFTNTVMSSGEEHLTSTKSSTPEPNMPILTDSVSNQQLSMQNIDDMNIDKNSLFKHSQNLESNPKSSTLDTKTITPIMLTEHQQNTLPKETVDKSNQHLKHEITDNENFQIKSVHHLMDTDKKETTHKETDEHMHMGRDVLKALPEKNRERNNFVSESIEESNVQKMNNILKQNDNTMKAATNTNKKLTEQLSMDSNESDRQQMTSSIKMKSAEEDLPLATVAQQHVNVMKTADLIHQEKNKDTTIGTKYKEVLANMNSVEDHLHLTNNLFDSGDRNENSMRAVDDQKPEPSLKSTLMKTKSSEDLIEANKSQKMAVSNEMFIGDSIHSMQEFNEPEIEDRFETKHKVLSIDMKSAELPLRHHLASTKSLEHHMHNHHSHHSHQSHHDSHWVNENRHHGIKAAEVKDIHMKNLHQHMPSTMGAFHDEGMLEQVRTHAHVSEKHPHMMSHSSRHDMNVMPGDIMKPNSHSSMRDAMEGLESEHMFRWQPSRDISRTAYTSGSTPSAVGVFPNANTGNCAIPLLLSCSPSVVSGSLAKAHPVAPPSYTAPSYRTEDDYLGFHNKRDVKKINDGKNINILRAPAIHKRKIAAMLENKM